MGFEECLCKFEWRKIGDVKCFRYLGVDMEAKVNHRVDEEDKFLGAVKNVWKESLLYGRAKMDMFEGIVVPAMLCECEAWGIDENV